MLDIVLINPRFDISYWGLELALPLLGKRANLPVACLPLLAALTPEEHRVTIIDENVEPIDFERLQEADIIGVTGMNVQRIRMREILEELDRRHLFAVVGGPWVSVYEDYFGELAKVIFVGEAEDTWPQFLEDYQRQAWKPRYEQTEKTDMAKVPPPRYELLRADRYLFGSVQFSRGCPFQCEFCDIIVTFGRKPRIKTAPQILTELEQLLKAGLPIAFIVDDNLIGNKKQIKEVLREVARWQHSKGFPLTFFTEASLDLADDAELMALMVECNIQSVFVGIESPNAASLRETKKFQNVREGGSISEKIRRIQDAGLDVWCGMILGFDSDDATIFQAQREFLKETRILHAMVGMLHAIPKTPLYTRLLSEGRLDLSDRPEFGTNVIPRKLTREELRNGYLEVMRDLYEPQSYFERLDDLFLDRRFEFGAARKRYWRSRPLAGLASQAKALALCVGLFARLMSRVGEAKLRKVYRERVWRMVKRKPDPSILFVYLVKCAMHYHHHQLSQQMYLGQSRIVNSFG